MSQLINDTIEAYNLYLEGELSIEDLEYGIEAGLISESLLLELDATMLSENEKIEEGVLNTMDFSKATKRKVADVLVGGSIVNHMIDRSHHKEIAEKLKKNGVSSEQLKKVRMLKDFADREPSGKIKRALQNSGRTLTKAASLVSNPVGGVLGHSIHKTHMKDLKEKLKGAGVSDEQMSNIKQLKK